MCGAWDIQGKVLSELSNAPTAEHEASIAVSLSLLGQHLSNWYWSETIHVLTKTKFRKKLCNINHIFRWCVLISTLSFLGASPAWTPALTECPCSGGGCQLLRMAHGLNFNEILMVFDVFLKAPLLPRGTRLWANLHLYWNVSILDVQENRLDAHSEKQSKKRREQKCSRACLLDTNNCGVNLLSFFS